MAWIRPGSPVPVICEDVQGCCSKVALVVAPDSLLMVLGTISANRRPRRGLKREVEAQLGHYATICSGVSLALLFGIIDSRGLCIEAPGRGLGERRFLQPDCSGSHPAKLRDRRSKPRMTRLVS